MARGPSDYRESLAGWDALLARLRPEIMRDAVADALRKVAQQVFSDYEAALRYAQIDLAEARTLIQRLKAELDEFHPDRNVIMAPVRYAESCMAMSRELEAGTVFRTTDTADEWVLGSDREWHPKV